MNTFIRKLRFGAPLTAVDVGVLARLAEPVRRVDRGDILAEGTEPRSIILVLDGWVCRYKHLENGKRQITALFLPGDLCEPFGALPRITQQPLAAITPVHLARVSPRAIRAAAETSERVEEALWWDLLFADAIQREHIVSLGRRSATERLGHLFCELHVRLDLVGLVNQCAYDMPLTQADLADLSGLSAVHVNRSIQELRGSGLLTLRGRRLTIHDVDALRSLSMFDSDALLATGAVPPQAGPFTLPGRSYSGSSLDG